MTRPGSVPLSELHAYTLRPFLAPAAVADRGDFYVTDGYLRPSLQRGHTGTQVCYAIDFTKGDDRSACFALDWSTLREKVIELVLRCASPVGPCRLISKPLHEGLDIWVIVGVQDDGSIFDPLADVRGPESTGPTVTL